mmetsp:Transcript_33412/g.81474  ORF Transcript_33412/g.81474 Transcript_33412/m.81474 type:complete len:393 (-) Transcript_33412:847-2025(-)
MRFLRRYELLVGELRVLQLQRRLLWGHGARCRLRAVPRQLKLHQRPDHGGGVLLRCRLLWLVFGGPPQSFHRGQHDSAVWAVHTVPCQLFLRRQLDQRGRMHVQHWVLWGVWAGGHRGVLAVPLVGSQQRHSRPQLDCLGAVSVRRWLLRGPAQERHAVVQRRKLHHHPRLRAVRKQHVQPSGVPGACFRVHSVSVKLEDHMGGARRGHRLSLRSWYLQEPRHGRHHVMHRVPCQHIQQPAGRHHALRLPLVPRRLCVVPLFRPPHGLLLPPRILQLPRVPLCKRRVLPLPSRHLPRAAGRRRARDLPALPSALQHKRGQRERDVRVPDWLLRAGGALLCRGPPHDDSPAPGVLCQREQRHKHHQQHKRYRLLGGVASTVVGVRRVRGGDVQ